MTGARGQDGTLLRKLLEQRGTEILGLDLPWTNRAADGVRDLDVRAEGELEAAFDAFEPDEVYHLAACHRSSEESGDLSLDFEMVDTNFRVAERLISRIAFRRPQCRILLAGTSQMYRAIPGEQTLVDELTPMTPVSFYGLTKAWSRSLLAHFRDHRGVFGCTAILFNHESALRSPAFLTRKVSMAAARAKAGLPAALHVFDIAGATDWSAASDVVEGMHLALAAPNPGDYVLASGRPHSVQELLAAAFESAGFDWREHTTFDQTFDEPRGVLVGDNTRARSILGWNPQVGFGELVGQMVDHDLALLAVK